MNWLLGLVIGAVIGGLIWGASGALVLGFLGWLAGVIRGSKKSAQPIVQATAAPMHVRSMDPQTARIERLERQVASLEARLTRIEFGAPVTPPPTPEVEAPPPIPVPKPELVPVAETPAPEPVVETVVPPTPVEPSKPNFIVAWFTGGNTIVRVGAVILVVGLLFLLKYAREHQLIPPELRVAGVALFGIGLLVLGWKLREKREGYAVTLQGAGIAALYGVVYSAMHTYKMIPPGAAFVLLAAVAGFSALIAVGQNSLALAIIGAGGGFLAPILASTGSGNHVALFSYYLILTAGLVAIAWFKAWRSLNVIGFVFTFLVALAWGEKNYRDELFGTTEPFLIAFFLMYVAIAILFARARPEGSGRYVDGTIVFGTPLAAFGFQAGMLRDTEFGLAYSAVAMAAVYVTLATILHRLRKERWALLAETFLALGVVFATLAIPLALDARWTSAAWALEGAAIVWVGVRQQRTPARVFGLLLQLFAGLAFVGAYQRMPSGPPLFDAPFVGAMLVALAGLWTNRLLSGAGERVTKSEVALAPAIFVWGLLWLVFAGHHEIETFLPRQYQLNAHAELFAFIALAFALIARRIDWREALWPAFALLPALFLVALVALSRQTHPFAAYGWISWPMAIAILVFLLREFDKREPDAKESHSALHIGTFLFVAALGAWEMNWAAAQVTAHHTAWSVTAVLLVPAMLVLFAVSKELDRRWPIDRHTRAYRIGAVVSTLVAMGAWSLYANATHDGTSSPLPYVPIMNAIDLGHVLVWICVMGSLLARRRSGLELPEALRGGTSWIIIAALTFVWLNGILIRSLHHWADVPYTLNGVIHSRTAQASLSVFWTTIALALMIYATRKGLRALWMVGGGLMAVVVVKLFLIDFGNLEGITRIVAFIAVGALMLVIGYFSPVPPKRVEEKVEEPA